ncbi:MAG: ABC transporter ATP-binding protein [Bacteroidota bacterium]|nr:ABC transporter ATP-binding protein [Bacteroidota bacterium]MDP4191111.1 ABC transporter ATP-binding protein [Bacteroidota bacterium]MDP4193483.1 ABC transporter ATP-binding protein [Bacteroidota bacterium]
MKSLLSLKKYFYRYKTKLLLGVLFILISNLGNVYLPLILKDSVNALQKRADYSQLIRYGELIALISLVSGVFLYLKRQTMIVASREIEYDLRQDFWQHIQKLSLRYFQNHSTGDIMAHATNDLNAVRTFVGPAVMYSVDTIVTLVLVLSIMLSLNVSLTIYSLLPLPLLSYLVYRLGGLIHIKFTRIQEKFSELTTKSQENFSGIRVIKSYVREENEIKEYKTLSHDYFNKNMDKVKIEALFQPVLFFVIGISLIVVIWIGGLKVINGTMDLGEILAFVVYLGLLIWPMIAVGWVVNLIQQASASMKRLNKMFEEDYEIQDNELTDHKIKEIKGKIEFKNVSFRYGENLPYVLRNISLEIPQGCTVAIIGHTGVGKTSFINLIPRLYDVTEGEVLIDGRNIKHMPLNILRKHIGIVPQETFLFSDTLANNITYGLSENKMEIVESVSEISQLKKDVESFPKGFETMLGERGITLSGGQKQRTCLARALAIDPNILILDDSFSAVDTHTEEEILKRLKAYMKDRTSIIISHRISTVKDADKIFVLDKGVIAEQGTHDELVQKQGIYADLHYKQLLEKELEELN